MLILLLEGFIAGDTPRRMHSFTRGRVAPEGKTMHPEGRITCNKAR